MMSYSYKLLINELLSYYTDLSTGTEDIDKNFELEFKLSLLKLDTIISKMKELQKLPELDNSLLSIDILKNSFIGAKREEYFRPEDYEKHFLVYSLLMHNDISKQTLIQIINGFFKYPKVRRNLNYRDVERTGTGSVRCKTNLRFAISYLREYGLINYFDNDKRSWSLTLPGFLIAAYMCMNKTNFFPTAYEFDIKRIYKPSCKGYNHIDVTIVDVINRLCIKENIDKVFNFIEDLSIDRDLIIISQKIFLAYRDFLNKVNDDDINGAGSKRFVKNMEEFIIRQNKNSKIEFFKSRFSDLINADKFLNELINATKVKNELYVQGVIFKIKEFDNFSVKNLKLYTENFSNCGDIILGHNIFHYPLSETLYVEYIITNKNYGIKDWKFIYTLILDYKHPYGFEGPLYSDKSEIIINKGDSEIKILKEYKLSELVTSNINPIEYHVGIHCDYEYAASEDFLVQLDSEK